jgi:thiamine biosynthesis lipoprotein
MEHVFAALDLVESLESQLTVYRHESEVMDINRQAADGPVAVESRLYWLFQLARRLHSETRGALDITSGPLSETWGFSRREGRLPSEGEIAAARERVGMELVVLDDERSTIAFRRPGVSVNLNSIGKGYALDRMAELLATNCVSDYLLHGGRSSVLASGNQPGHGDGWVVGLRHPLRPAKRLAEFTLRGESLSTSGSGTQFFIRRGRRYGHILDPRTGRPAEGLFSATVIAPTAAEANGPRRRRRVLQTPFSRRSAPGGARRSRRRCPPSRVRPPRRPVAENYGLKRDAQARTLCSRACASGFAPNSGRRYCGAPSIRAKPW